MSVEKEMPVIDAIIFDLGNVLIRWDPGFVFDKKYFNSEEKRAYFFEHICTADWNEMQDEGRSIVEGTMDLIRQFPDWEPAIRDYYGRWTEMLRGPIKGSVEIFRKLKEAGKYRLYALTNWNAHLFEIALVRYDFLHWFNGRAVSGEEKTRKPHPEFFRVLLDRYDVEPSRALFIDDSERNVKAAQALGIQCILFRDPVQLSAELTHLGIL